MRPRRLKPQISHERNGFLFKISSSRPNLGAAAVGRPLSSCEKGHTRATPPSDADDLSMTAAGNSVSGLMLEDPRALLQKNLPLAIQKLQANATIADVLNDASPEI